MDVNDDASAGTLTYTTPAGANVTVTFLSDQGVRAGRLGRVRVLRHGPPGLVLAAAHFAWGRKRFAPVSARTLPAVPAPR